MNILFLGGLYTHDDEESIVKKSLNMPNFAANVHQWNIINGIDEINDIPTNILNADFVGSYPNEYKDIYIRKKHWSHKDGANDYSIGFLNIFIINHIIKIIAMTIKSIEWVIKTDNSNPVLIIYSMHNPFLFAGAITKMIFKKVTLCLIIPDLPTFFISNAGRGFIYRFFKKIDCWFMEHLIKKFDCFVLLTNQMKDKLKIQNKPYIVIEGIANEQHMRYKNNAVSNAITITYTGKIDIEFGIKRLLDAFLLIKEDNYKLIICGNGNGDKIVKEYALKDSRIDWRGSLTRSEVLEIQANSTVLVNPRSAEEEFTKYSFPSKTIEYMLSGRPVIMNKLEGIPEEYYEYINWFDGEDPESMVKTIMRLCSYDKQNLDIIGEKARDFILECKNETIQAKKMINMIKKLIDENI